MPRNLKTVAVHDPTLIAVFGRSRKSYERNRDDLIAKLDAAARRTRAAAVGKAEPVKKRANVNVDLSPVNAGSPPLETIHVRAPKASLGAKDTDKIDLKVPA